MRLRTALMSVFCILSLVCSADAQPPGYVSLFDGQSLDGWSQRNGTATYRVEDGCIVGQTSEDSPNSFLCSEKLYGDFDLIFEVKVDAPLNSGVQIRSQSKGDTPDGRVNGPQVEIATGNQDGSTSGYIYGEAAGGWMTADEDRTPHPHFVREGWNSYRVVATGPRIQTWVNGRQISDLVHDERFNTHPKGFIGLQVHAIGTGQGPYEVRWRNLKLRDLTDFVSLYNGKDLSGWETTGNWLPQDDGSLLIQPRDGEQGWQRYDAYLWSEKKYKNFVLDLEYAYPEGGNSGVYFRVGDRNNPVEKGIEVQILDSSQKEGEMGHHDHGGVIRTQGASKNMSRPPHEWNHMIVSCRGNHLQVVLNGEQIIDLQLDKGAISDRPAEGYIGFQDHGTPNNIKFRNIRIRELADPGEGNHIDADGVKVWFNDEGKGIPVVLIHGFAANADMNWQMPGISKTLAGNYRVISIDVRGHGHSDKPPTTESYGQEMVTDVIRILDHLKIERAHIVGYSMGGFITMKLMTEHPDRVISATLGGSGGIRDDFDHTWDDKMAGKLDEGLSFADAMQASLPETVQLAESELAMLKVVFRANDSKALAAILRSWPELAVSYESLESNNIPSYFIYGDGEDARTRSYIEALKDRMGQCQFQMIEGTDHMTTVASPEFKQSIIEFIEANSSK